MAAKVRWGILGAGNIAKKFAQGLASAPGAELAAVGSRTKEKADQFADQFLVPRRHVGYEALAGDDQVDVVYVATPHSLHMEHGMLCLNAGKAVLCEKPLTINAAQAEQLVACARKNGRFLMEAMWTRFLPHVAKVRQLLADGAIGQVRMVMADFGFRATPNPQGRLFNPQLGGGGLLDVGVYCVSLAHMVLGAPKAVAALAELGPTGVDEQAAMLLGYEAGPLAVLATGVRTTTPHEATIMGTDGFIRMLSPWWRPGKLMVKKAGKEEILDVPFEGNGYNYQAVEVMNCLRQGKTESSIMPLAESLAVMRTLDRIRAQWGLKYPME